MKFSLDETLSGMESEQTAEENSQDEKFDNVKVEAIGDASRRTYTCQDDLVYVVPFSVSFTFPPRAATPLVSSEMRARLCPNREETNANIGPKWRQI